MQIVSENDLVSRISSVAGYALAQRVKKWAFKIPFQDNYLLFLCTERCYNRCLESYKSECARQERISHLRLDGGFILNPA